MTAVWTEFLRQVVVDCGCRNHRNWRHIADLQSLGWTAGLAEVFWPAGWPL